MKIVLRIFNIIIMALSMMAGIFLFVAPSFSFNSDIALDVGSFSQFVPNTEYSDDIDIVQLLGTDEVHFSIQFEIDRAGLTKTSKGDREVINNDVIFKNIDSLLQEIREPVELITDFEVRTIVEKIITQEITTQVKNARDTYAQKYPDQPVPTAEAIMEEVGLNAEYFNNFAKQLYLAMDKDDATVDSVTNTLFAQVDEALVKAENSGFVDTSSFGEDTKATVSENLVNILDQLKLIGEGNKVKKISEISYIYLAEFVKQKLNGKVSEEELAQKAGESNFDYSNRLLSLFVTEIIPDMVYTIIKYVSLGLYIGMFVFAFIWGFVLLMTLIKTLTRKPWTFFGPWFWIIGPLQLVLGLGLTVAGKFVLPKYPILASLGLPIKTLILAPRTYALVPSIIFLAFIVIGIAYGIIKGIAKREDKMMPR